MVRADGYIKILDFGLAQSSGFTDNLHDIPLGTLGYMSPEQTRGETLTPASDVFSLGITLLELATGRHPFLAGTASGTTTAIAQQEVEYAAPPGLPGGKTFAALLRAMLDKDPARRPGMDEVARRLERVAALSARANRGWIWIVAACIAVTAGVFLWFRTRTAILLRFSTPVAVTNYSGIEQQPAFAPDGSRIAFIWSGPDGRQDDVYIRTVRGVDEPPRRLTNDANREFAPVWSPDGQYLAWHRRVLDGGDGELWVAAVRGIEVGTARVIATVFNDGGFYGLAWTADSKSLISRDRGTRGFPLMQIQLADGSKTLLTNEPGVQDYQPVLSPDRKRLLFFRYNISRPQVCFMEAAPTFSQPVCRDLRTGLGSATWTLDSRAILLNTGDALWLWNTSPSEPMTKLQEGTFSNLTTDSAGQRYAFNRTITDSNIWQFDVANRSLAQLISSSEEDSEPQFSHDGGRILFRSKRTGHFELYVCNRDGSDLRQLTHLSSHCGSARWSPDSKWIAYDSVQDFPGSAGLRKFDNIYVMPAEGGAGRRLTGDTSNAVVPNWSADSRWIYYTLDKERQTWKVSVDGGPAVLVDKREMWGAVESADGKWICYEQPTTGKGLWRRPVNGGPDERIPGTERLTYRTWELRGDSLIFLRSAPLPGFFRVSLEHALSSSARFTAPSPRRLLLGPATMSVSPDGRTILYTSEDLSIGDIYVFGPSGALGSVAPSF